MSFKASWDHSKWAVAFDQPWTCIGDLNRNVIIPTHFQLIIKLLSDGKMGLHHFN